MIKKLLPILLCLVLLCGCAAQHTHLVTLEGYELTVDVEKNTITHGTDVYSYKQDSSHLMETTVTIYYPNGATYKKTFTYGIVVSGGSGSSSSSSSSDSAEDNGTYTGNFDKDRYVPGLVLAKAVRTGIAQKKARQEEKAETVRYLSVGILSLLIGIVDLRFPEALWHLKHWWCVDGGEPSQAYIDMSRFAGVLLLIIGGILVLMGIF